MLHCTKIWPKMHSVRHMSTKLQKRDNKEPMTEFIMDRNSAKKRMSRNPRKARPILKTRMVRRNVGSTVPSPATALAAMSPNAERTSKKSKLFRTASPFTKKYPRCTASLASNSAQ